MTRFLKFSLWIAAMAVGLGSSTAKADFISTLGSWDGNSAIHPFGEPFNTPSYGQTVTVGSDNVLDSFSFRMRVIGGDPGDTLSFKAYVMAWDGAKASGPVLYQSSVITIAPPSTDAFTVFNVSTGGISLASGNQYVLFMSTLNDLSGSGTATEWGHIDDNNAYTGGRFVFTNTSSFAGITGSDWDNFIEGDLAFTAGFSASSLNAVPAPAGAVLFGLGLTGLGGFRLLRRKNAVAAR